MTRLAALVLPLLLVAGCSGSAGRPAAGSTPVPFAACGALARPPAGSATGAPSGVSASGAPAGGSGAAGGSGVAGGSGAAGAFAAGGALPDLRLPCMAGGPAVALRDVRGPAVINLWASWCAPCRSELPAFQRLADRHGGKLHVIGVDTRDRPEAAVSLASDLGLTFPSLADPDERLRVAIHEAALPVTVFVDGSGRVRYIHNSTALDDQKLAALIRRHLDVRTAA